MSSSVLNTHLSPEPAMQYMFSKRELLCCWPKGPDGGAGPEESTLAQFGFQSNLQETHQGFLLTSR